MARALPSLLINVLTPVGSCWRKDPTELIFLFLTLWTSKAGLPSVVLSPGQQVPDFVPEQLVDGVELPPALRVGYPLGCSEPLGGLG